VKMHYHTQGTCKYKHYCLYSTKSTIIVVAAAVA